MLLVTNMFYGEEKVLVLQGLDGLLRSYAWDNKRLSTIYDWIQENQTWLGVPAEDYLKGDGYYKTQAVNKTGAKSLAGLLRAQWRAEKKQPSGPVASNIATLAKGLGFTRIETGFLAMVCWNQFDGRFCDLADRALDDKAMDGLSLIATVLRCKRADLWALTEPQGPVGRGLVRLDDAASNSFPFEVSTKLLKALLPPNSSLLEMEASLFGQHRSASLTMQDYDHIAAERDFVRDLFCNATAQGEQGINILLYGPPGSGKTEFCKTLAGEAGVSLFAIGEEDKDGEEPARWERLAELQMGHSLFKGRKTCALLVDEMEDIVTGGNSYVRRGREFRRAGSKAYFNRLLENATVPTLWTSNDVSYFDPANLRRMTYILEMPEPTQAQRRVLWARLLEKQGVATEARRLDALASRSGITPGLAASTIRAAQLTGDNGQRLELAVAAMDKAINNHKAEPNMSSGQAMDPALVNADMDVKALCIQLSQPGAPRDFSLCLFGPPGTGKSALVRMVARSMGMEVVQKRASDLLSMWIGESEANIANAFRQAEQDKIFLVFDEADSLLSDRSDASRSWEISQVNEMLTWMERHPYPFACTTNLMDRVDKAALRRFTFKLKLGYLTASQLDRAWRYFFDMPATPDALRLTNLTPGDFAVVKNRLRFMTDTPSAPQITELLAQEAAVKPGASARIGF